LLDKKLEAMEMSQLTAFENDELLSRDLFANESHTRTVVRECCKVDDASQR